MLTGLDIGRKAALVALLALAVTSASAHAVPSLVTATTATATGETIYGQAATFTSQTVQFLSGMPVSRGTVTFTAGGTTVPGCAAVPVDAQGAASCTTSSLDASVARYLIWAYYTDGDYATALFHNSAGTALHRVDRADLVIAADPRTITYGDPMPTDLTATVTGLVAGETFADTDLGQLTCTLAAGTPATAGVHNGAIRCETLSPISINYLVGSFQSAALTIQKAPQSISFPALGPMVYGDVRPAGGFATSGLPVQYETLTPSVCTVTDGSVRATGVGECALRALQTGGQNHLAAPVIEQVLTIGKAPLRLEAEPVTWTIGQPLPAVSSRLTGFVAGETLSTSGVTGAAECALPASMPDAPGVVAGAITCTAGSLSALHYFVQSVVPGALTVLVARIGGTLDGDGSSTTTNHNTTNNNVTNVGIVGGSPAQPPPAAKAPALSLLTKKLKSAKRARLKLRSTGAMAQLKLALKRNGKSVAKGALATLNGAGGVTLKASRKLAKGLYTLEGTWVDAAGRKGKKRFSIRVR